MTAGASSAEEEELVWKIAFYAQPFQQTPRGIFIIDADGTNKTYIGEGGLFSWSPDGTEFALVIENDIFVSDIDLGNQMQLTDRGDLGFDRWPSWSRSKQSRASST